MQGNDLISIVMSVWNGQQYISTSVESILNQSYKNFEFIIINDGSTDSTAEIIESYKDDRIVLLNNDTNLGITRSLNRGISVSKGEYIARQDADDISHPRRLEILFDILKSNKNIAVISASFSNFSNEPPVVSDIEAAGIEFFYVTSEVLKAENPILHGSVIIRKDVLTKAGFYNEEYLRSQDYELWLRIVKNHNIAIVNQPLYLRRVHDECISFKHIREQCYFAELAKAKTIYAKKRLGIKGYIRIQKTAQKRLFLYSFTLAEGDKLTKIRAFFMWPSLFSIKIYFDLRPY